MIAPGALVIVKQTGAVLYVVKAPAPGGRWYLAGKRIDHRGRSGTSPAARPAPTYSPGTMIEHTMRSRRSSHVFASVTITEQCRKILGKGVFSDGTE
jgi:hypothetical protein